MKAGKNLRPVTPKKHYNHLPEIKFVEEQIDLDFAGPLDFVRGHCNYILLFFRQILEIHVGKNYFKYFSQKGNRLFYRL